MMQCPFCGEDDFDAVGLKAHFLRWCEVFNNIPTPEADEQSRCILRCTESAQQTQNDLNSLK